MAIIISRTLSHTDQLWRNTNKDKVNKLCQMTEGGSNIILIFFINITNIVVLPMHSNLSALLDICYYILDIHSCLVCEDLWEIFPDETILLVSLTNTQSHQQIDKNWTPRGESDKVILFPTVMGNGVSWPKTELSRYQQVVERGSPWSLACHYKANLQEKCSLRLFLAKNKERKV